MYVVNKPHADGTLYTSSILFDLPEVPDFDHTIISPGEQEGLFFVPRYYIDISTVGGAGDHTGFAGGGSYIPHSHTPVNRARGKHLHTHYM